MDAQGSVGAGKRLIVAAMVGLLLLNIGGIALPSISPNAGRGAPSLQQPAKAPDQRWGSAAQGAARPERLVGSPGNHVQPATVRAQFPLWQPAAVPQPAPNVASVVDPPDVSSPGFQPEASQELPEQRGEFQRRYRNPDGTQTTEFSPSPINYRRPDGSWVPIDSRLVPGQAPAAGWRNAADAVDLRLAARADAPALAQVSLDGGESIGFGLAGAGTVAGSAGQDGVTYPNVLPLVDLRLSAIAGGVKETLVLNSAAAARRFVFPLQLTGVSARMIDGQVVFVDASGRRRAAVPAGYMQDSGVADGGPAVSAGVTYTLTTVDGRPAIAVDLDQAWLRDPARRFPILVDPSVETGNADASMVVQGSSSRSGSSELLVGREGGSPAASYLKFDGVGDRLVGHTIFGVQLAVVNFDAPSCRPRTVSVHPVTQAWSVSTGQSYPGPSVGGALTSSSFAYGFVAFGQSQSACPVKPALFNLGNAGRKLVQGWADGQPNFGLSLRASVDDSGAWKRFAGSSTANPPRLYVTHSPYNAKYAIEKPVPEPPVLQNQSGRVKVSVTNRSAAAWTATGYYLAYRAYDAKTGRAVTQQRSAGLPGTVARGAKVTLDAEIKPLPPGQYFIDFTMARAGGPVFTDEQVPPARMVIVVVDIPPVVQEVFPPNGYQTPTLTPQLWARAVDIDAPVGSNLQYRFELCDTNSAGDPVNCSTTAYQTSPVWPVPAGRLVWSKTYSWRGFVKDASTEVPTPRATLIAAVPQPAVTSRVANSPYASQEREFDPQIGNFSTTAVDAPVVTVGPELSVIRTYNSLDPRRGGLFGAGWTTRYDMRLVPDNDGTGNVVVGYPDGQEVRFGRNPDGTFAAPPGRTAGLSFDSATATWRLLDKSATTYTFASDGRPTRISDAAGRAVVLTYNANGTLAKAQVSNSQTNTAGRALRFTWTGAHVTTVTTDPVNGTALSWTYTYSGDVLTRVCGPGSVCTNYTYAQGSHYRTAVLDDQPDAYHRLGDDGIVATSEISANLGKDVGTYHNVTLGTTGVIAGSADKATTFNGTSSYVELAAGTVKKSRDTAVELWFKANPTGGGGPLLGYQDKAVGQTSTVGIPVLYLGTDGRLHGQFGATTIAPILTTGTVNDGAWHHVVLSAMGDTQTLYLDGAVAGTLTAPRSDSATLTFNQIGAAYASTPTAWPAWGTASLRWFNGTIDEVALYPHPLGAAAVAAHRQLGLQPAEQLSTLTLASGKAGVTVAYDPATDRVTEYTDHNGGTWKVGAPAVYGSNTDLRRGVEVRDPADRLYLYEYDALAGRVIRTGMPAGLGLRDEDRPGLPEPSPTPSPTQVCASPDPSDPQFCTVIPPSSDGPVFDGHSLDGIGIRTFGYDANGYQNVITNENGDATRMTYDARGNVISRTTCRNGDTDCHTEYYTYPATPSNPYDPRNDLPTEHRDARSAGPTDNTYRTTYTYTATGELATQTNPDGGVVRHVYTTGGEAAVGGGAMPPNLPLTTTDTRNAVTRYAYYQNGDLARVTEPSGLVTAFTYDALGRKVSETETSDAIPPGVSTTYTYDAMSRLLTTTEPATTEAVSGGRHQGRTTNTYDVDGNLARVDVSDLLGGDATRTTSYEYDDHNRAERVTDAEGNETAYGYDQFGNKTSMVDANGNRYEYGYTARNMIAEVRLRNWDGDPPGSPPPAFDYVVLSSFAYDFAGRKVRHTDAMGRTLQYTYYDDDLVKTITLKDFHNPNGSTRDIVVENDTYDGAGNVIRQVTGNGTQITDNTYDRAGRVASTVLDPGGLARRTSYTYDANGNVTQVARTGLASNVPWTMPAMPEVVDYTYDLAGNLLTETQTAGSTSLVTSHTYDQRGLRTSTTEPRGNVAGADKAAYTTNFSYDEMSRPTLTTGPPVSAESGGGAPTVVRAAFTNGIDTFDEVVSTKDSLGNITRTEYDRLGRAVREIAPTYTPPGPSVAITPTTVMAYDGLGNLAEQTDPRGNVTRFGYDRLGRMVTKDEPASTNNERALTRYTYTRTGQMLSMTDPTGARTEHTYDDMDREITATQIERRPVAGTFTTRYTYDDADNVVGIVAPSGAATVNTFDSVGDLTRTVDPAGVTTQHGYDFSSREVRLADGGGRTSRSDHDALGRLIGESDLDTSGNVVRSQSYAYDPSGNLIRSTDPFGRSSTYSYDAANRLTQQVEPVSDTSSITTSFGYDTAGNRTRYTDGRGNSTIFTVNSLGLPQSVIEPATTAHPSAADRSWTMSYDAAGNPVRYDSPGGVTRQRTFDAAGRLTGETGAGAETGTADRILGYNLRDELTSVSAPGGTDTYSYDDRGNLLSATGPSGPAGFGYDADSQMTTRTDEAGTAQYTYRNGRLDTLTDAITGTVQRLGYDVTGNLATVDYGAGRVRTFGYDPAGRLASDTLRNSSGATVTATSYGYDLDDHITSKNTTGTADAGTNTYSYDYAGRLTSWVHQGSTADYGWDAAGNRVRAGSKTATYDERNRLLSDGDYTYTYTPRGTLRGRTSSGLTEDFAFDAFDRLVSASGTSYAYDGLDRLASSGGVPFSYAGQSDEVVADGTAQYAYDPDGNLLATGQGGTTRLAVADGHGDIVGDFAPTDTTLGALADSTAYDPFGQVTGRTGQRANLGFQGSWTDPATGQVDMGARWYNPGTGAFDSRDTATYTSGESILANRYTYAAGDPLDNDDPDGNWPSCGWCHKVVNKVSGWVSTGWHYVQTGWQYAQKAWNYAMSGLRAIGHAITHPRETLRKIVNGAKRLWDRYAPNWAKQRAAQAAQAVRAAKAAVTRTAKRLAEHAAKFNPLPALKAAVKPLLTAVKTVIHAVQHPAQIVQVVKDAVKDLAKHASTLYHQALEKAAPLIATVSKAAHAVSEFAQAIAPTVAGIAAGALTTGGCLVATGGVGSAACVVAGFAVGSAVTSALSCPPGRSIAGCAAIGAASGVVGGAVFVATGGMGGGLSAAIISGGLSSMASTAADEVLTTGSVDAAEVVRSGVTGAATAGIVRGAGRLGARIPSGIGCRNSFAAGTAVLMADGSHKDINDVRAGDRVLATDPTTGRTEARVVTDIIIGSGDKQLVSVAVDTDGDVSRADSTVTATAGHPFWVDSQHRWVDAADLAPGYQFETADHRPATVVGTQTWREHQTVYNLTVDGLHTFYVVAGDTTILVHNCPKPNEEYVGRHRGPNEAPDSDYVGRHRGPESTPGVWRTQVSRLSHGVQAGFDALDRYDKTVGMTSAVLPTRFAYINEAVRGGFFAGGFIKGYWRNHS